MFDSADADCSKTPLADGCWQQSSATVGSDTGKQIISTKTSDLSTPQLPTELWIRIMEINWPRCHRYTVREGRNRDLRHLSLTCRKLRPIAQEVLFKSSDVPQGKMVPYVLALCRKPDLAAKVQELFHDESSPLDSDFFLEVENWIEIERYVHELESRSTNTTIVEAQKELHCQELSITALLFTKAPNLQRLYLDNNLKRSRIYSKCCLLLPWNGGYKPLWRNSVEEELCKNLQEIYIEDQIGNRYLRNCLNLKRIEIPMYCVRWGWCSNWLPRSLENLRVHLARGWDLWDMYFLHSLITDNEQFPNLNTVEISGLSYLFRGVSITKRRLGGPGWDPWEEFRDMIKAWASSVAVQFRIEGGEDITGTGSFPISPQDRYLTHQSLIEIVKKFMESLPGV